MPVLKSSQILQLINSKGAGTVGAAMAMQRHLDRDRSQGNWGVSTDQQRFLEAYLDHRPRANDRPTSYPHPEQAARFVPQGTGASGADGRTGLEPADLIWMQRLPTDPTQVTYEQAVQLASLVQLTKPNTADRRLAESIWRPVKAVHDLKAAEAALESARQPLPDVPSTALGALADAVQTEVPQLTGDEVVTRASTMLRDALDARSAEREQRIAEAEGTMAALKAAETQREALTA